MSERVTLRALASLVDVLAFEIHEKSEQNNLKTLMFTKLDFLVQRFIEHAITLQGKMS